MINDYLEELWKVKRNFEVSACHLYNADEENMFTFLTMNLKLTRSLSKFKSAQKVGRKF